MMVAKPKRIARETGREGEPHLAKFTGPRLDLTCMRFFGKKAAPNRQPRDNRPPDSRLGDGCSTVMKVNLPTLPRPTLGANFQTSYRRTRFNPRMF